MKDKPNIPNIRTLLHKYYEADTTPEEEQLLKSFFHDSPEEDIPEDMNEDKKIFSSFTQLHADSSKMDVPAELVKNIYSLTENCDGLNSGRAQRNWNRTTVYAAAACICLVLTLGIRWVTSSAIQTSGTAGHTTEISFKHPSPPSAIHYEENEVSESLEESYMTPVTSQRKSMTTATIAPDFDETDGYIEITDPEEAQRILTEIGRLLALNSKKTNEAIIHLEKTVEDYKELTKSILQ